MPRRLPLCVVLALVAASLAAQTYPLPVPVTSPPAICTTCPPPYTGLPTFPYDAPIADFAGRYVDSTAVRDKQFPLRTYRAEEIAIVPELDRIFMIIGGGTFATYVLSSFIDEQLGTEMATAANGEKYLPFFSSVYPEAPGSGWTTVSVDGQERLGGFDWDRRGYRYLAYSVFGWGIVSDDGSLVAQVFDPPTVPVFIAHLRDGDSHYVAVSDGWAATDIYDVTDPQSPSFVRTLPFGFQNFAKVSDGISHTIALVAWPSGILRIFEAGGLASGGAPVADVTPVAGFRFVDATTDGLRFFALQNAGANGPTSLSTVSNEDGVWAEAVAPFPYPLKGDTLSLDGGVLAVTGVSLTPVALTLRLFRLADGAVLPIDAGGFFENYYTNPLPGYAVPGYGIFVDAAAHFRNGSLRVFAAVSGLGDVYEVTAAANAPPVILFFSPAPAAPPEQRFVLGAFDPEGDAVRFHAVGLPDGATFDPETGELVWTLAPGEFGEYPVRVGAADPDGGAAWLDVVLTAVEPKITIHRAQAIEGSEGVVRTWVRVTLSVAASGPVSFDWATADGTALAGSDYLAASGAFVFAPGQTSGAIQPLVLGDREIEPHEYFEVVLTAPLGATLGTDRAMVMIVDDDAQVPPPPPPCRPGSTCDP